MDKKRCFLIGHHDAPESIYPALQREIKRHITELGVTEFIMGHYGNFDRMAARALVAAKQIHQEISLWLYFRTTRLSKRWKFQMVLTAASTLREWRMHHAVWLS